MSILCLPSKICVTALSYETLVGQLLSTYSLIRYFLESFLFSAQLIHEVKMNGTGLYCVLLVFGYKVDSLYMVVLGGKSVEPRGY